jgi:hypothetical protein
MQYYFPQPGVVIISFKTMNFLYFFGLFVCGRWLAMSGKPWRAIVHGTLTVMRVGTFPRRGNSAYDHGHAIDRVAPMLLMVVSWVWSATDRLRKQNQRVAHGLTTTGEGLYEKNECVCLCHHR